MGIRLSVELVFLEEIMGVKGTGLVMGGCKGDER